MTETQPWINQTMPMRDGGHVDLSILRERFYSSDIGRMFYDQTPRYVKRNTEIPRDNRRAIEYIGEDACPVGHQLELADIHLREVLRAEHEAQTLFMPSPDDIALLEFIASFHDIGESEHPSLLALEFNTVGDIPCGEKTDKQRKDEAEIRVYLLNRFFYDIDEDLLRRAEAIILHKPLPGDEHLHEIYEAAHDLQVFSTIDVARENSTNKGFSSHARTGLGKFASRVTTSHLPVLSKRAYFVAAGERITQEHALLAVATEQIHDTAA